MAVTVDKLKFFQSERMADTTDGGGRMSSTPLVSGLENQIFDDISDVDRAAGDLSIRKIYGAVTSADTDKYLDAGIVVFREPADPSVSVLTFSTGSFYDQRQDLKTKLEETITRGGRWNGWLWGQHIIGQRAVVLWQRPDVELPPVGQRLELVAKAATVEQYSQFLWITRVTENLRTRYDDKGAYLVREVICEISEPLLNNYLGNEPTRADPLVSTATALIYDTRYNPEAVALFGVRPTVVAAAVNDYSIQVDSLYASIIPTSLTETALPDVNPGGDSPAIIAGNTATISFATTTQCIKPNVSMYLGTGAKPGSINIVVSGATLTDDNQKMRLSGSEVGQVDYGNGIIRWNDSVPNYTASSKTVTFQPAARPLRVADTAAMGVTPENNGYVWIMTLVPIPAPLTLRVAYRVKNKWYVLADQGAGQLVGADSSYGSGSLNFTTGTVTLTTGALPDVNSEVIYSWGTPVNYTARGGDPVDAPVVRGQTAHPGVASGTVEVSWTVAATTYTLTDSMGDLTGTGGTGGINYATGEWWVRPTIIPPVDTVFGISYQYGTATYQEQTFSGLVADGNGDALITLAQSSLLPGSIYVTWTMMPMFPFWSPYSGPGLVTLRDNGSGTMVGTLLAVLVANNTSFYQEGAVSVNYANGTILLPMHKPFAGNVKVSQFTSYRIGDIYRLTYTGSSISAVEATAEFLRSDIPVTVRYATTSSLASAAETVTLSQLELDLTKGYGETIVAGSVRFLLGNSIYVDTAGQLYRDPGPDTGAGTLCGSLDRSSGRARISSWTAGGANAVTLQSCVTELAGQPIEEVVFRTPVSPLRPGTLQLRYQLLDGTVKTKTVDGTGLLEDTDCKINVDYSLGVVRARFGLWKNDAGLTPQEKAEFWYNPDARVDFAGTLKIWKPALVLADSVIYNAVAQTTLPPDSALLGINAARLPVDGKGLIFNVGRLALVHHTASFAASSLSPTQVLDCGRVRLYRVAIDDHDGKRLPASFYTVDRIAGTATMAADLNLTGYSSPYVVSHTVADLARIVATDINGTLSFNKALSHVYPEDDSRVSGVLYVGTLQARVTGLFAQTTWTNVWSNSRIGDAPLAQYNNVQYPIAVSNAGAYSDRFLIKFTSATTFQIIGENLGLIDTGTINADCTPVNVLTGVAYFSIDYRGWGSGWATGNCLRFNLVGASYPVDVIRAIQPSNPSGLDVDSVEFLLIGNVDT